MTAAPTRSTSTIGDAKIARMFAGAPGLRDFGGAFGPALGEPSAFRARLISMTLAGVQVHKIDATAHVGVLGSVLGRGTRADVIRFVFFVQGSADTAESAPPRLDPVGSARLLSPTEVVPFNATTTTTLLIVDAPMLVLPSVLGAARRGSSQPAIGPNAVTSATIAFLETTLSLAAASGSDDVFHVERALTGLLTAVAHSAIAIDAVEATDVIPVATDPTVDDLTFERAKALIRAESHRPELSITDLAERLGTSQRSLQRLFAKRELSVSEAIRNERLEVLAARLADPAATDSVAALVTASGFGAIDYARRAFVQRFGVSMSHYRRGLRAD
ncbi:helix-turn-helix domain-containing protein [Microbacteriaceae bacterium VKM Ac-2854]|nr:helix-turn-helix domain-containing protein [Microbacteriaceae bacterium VKM Ac-2854]